MLGQVRWLPSLPIFSILEIAHSPDNFPAHQSGLCIYISTPRSASHLLLLISLFFFATQPLEAVMLPGEFSLFLHVADFLLHIYDSAHPIPDVLLCCG